MRAPIIATRDCCVLPASAMLPARRSGRGSRPPPAVRCASLPLTERRERGEDDGPTARAGHGTWRCGRRRRSPRPRGALRGRRALAQRRRGHAAGARLPRRHLRARRDRAGLRGRRHGRAPRWLRRGQLAARDVGGALGGDPPQQHRRRPQRLRGRHRGGGAARRLRIERRDHEWLPEFVALRRDHTRGIRSRSLGMAAAAPQRRAEAAEPLRGLQAVR